MKQFNEERQACPGNHCFDSKIRHNPAATPGGSHQVWHSPCQSPEASPQKPPAARCRWRRHGLLTRHSGLAGPITSQPTTHPRFDTSSTTQPTLTERKLCLPSASFTSPHSLRVLPIHTDHGHGNNVSNNSASTHTTTLLHASPHPTQSTSSSTSTHMRHATYTTRSDTPKWAPQYCPSTGTQQTSQAQTTCQPH